MCQHLYYYVSRAHLATNHSLEKYYHLELLKLCDKSSQTCFTCILVNHLNYGSSLGVFPLDAKVGEVLHMDLIKSVVSSSGFQHILTVKCPISQYLLFICMKS